MKQSSKQRAASKAAFALAAKLSLEQRKYRAQRARIQRDAYKEIQKVLCNKVDPRPGCSDPKERTANSVRCFRP